MLSKEILSGLRVLEWTEGVAGPYCAKVLSDLGAEVIKIESPGGGDPARQRGFYSSEMENTDEGGLFLLMNSNKKGITLDPSSFPDRDLFLRLIRKVDCLIEDRPPGEMEKMGLGPSVLLDIQPRLVITSITPFGQSGPYSNYKAYPLNTFHGGGSGYRIPFDDDHPEKPPIRVWRHCGEIESGTTGALATLAAVFNVMKTGEGQHIDISKQEALMNLERMDLGRYPNEALFLSRFVRPYRLGGKFRCLDGYVVIIPVQEHQWKALVRLLGDPEWAGDEMCRDEFTRGEHYDKIQGRISEIIASMSKEDLYHKGQGYGVPISPIYKVSELRTSEQLKSRGFFVPMEHPRLGTLLLPSLPYVLQEGERREYKPAPKLGQDNENVFCGLLGLTKTEFGEFRRNGANPRDLGGTKSGLTGSQGLSSPREDRQRNNAPGPLSGVRILDFTWAWAGPHATYLLATLGAEVIKVESRNRPDHARMRSLATGPSYNGIDTSPWFNDMNPDKLGLSVDLKRPEAIDIIKRLAVHCDVITDNFRPGVMKKLGLSYEAFRSVKPDIIMASSSLNGGVGPERNYVGYAPNFSALGGGSALTGRQGETPSVLGGRSDLLSGVYLALGVASALCFKRRTGKGLYMDMSSREALATLIGEAFMEHAVSGNVPMPEGNADENMAPHNCYPCQGEDKWISIAVGSDEEWRTLCGLMGNPPWTSDARFQGQEGRIKHSEDLDLRLGEWTRNWARDELIARLQEAGVAAFGSMSNKDLWEDSHIKSRNLWVRIKPRLLEERVMLMPPFRFSKTPARIDRPAPLMGEHNRYVLGEILGLPDEEIDELDEKGILQ